MESLRILARNGSLIVWGGGNTSVRSSAAARDLVLLYCTMVKSNPETLCDIVVAYIISGALHNWFHNFMDVGRCCALTSLPRAREGQHLARNLKISLSLHWC